MRGGGGGPTIGLPSGHFIMLFFGTITCAPVHVFHATCSYAASTGSWPFHRIGGLAQGLNAQRPCNHNADLIQHGQGVTAHGNDSSIANGRYTVTTLDTGDRETYLSSCTWYIYTLSVSRLLQSRLEIDRQDGTKSGK